LHRIYRVIAVLAAPAVALILFWKGLRNRAYWERVEERFGYGSSGFDTPSIWVHAVSVGEVVAASSLISALRENYPQFPIVVTTATPTGAKVVHDLFGNDVLHSYAPYDMLGSVRRFFDRMQPRLTIVIEREWWPNMYAESRARGVPLVLANARISPRSAARYRRVISLFRQALSDGILIAAQSEQDAKRFLSLGANPASTTVTGNLKADLAFPSGVTRVGQALRQEHFAARPVWVAASTHAGEEEAALEAHARVRAALPDALLILVPRHPERFNGVAELLKSRGVASCRRSLDQAPAPEHAVFLADSLGELPMFYAAADVAFVGGSLAPIGGHNLLEPAALKLPIIAGPHNFNSEDIAILLRESGGLQLVADGAELGAAVLALLQDPALRRLRGGQAHQVVLESGGALNRLLDLLAPLLAAPR
jgi:3-deoxy-D-manno-octulosonic-acid transferase